MDEFRPKPWLTPAQQVQHLESEGIKFELTSKDAAERYLKANNNFFRINLFRKGVSKVRGWSERRPLHRLGFWNTSRSCDHRL